MLIVSEIFHSIQGEGPKAGHPAVFLRLAGCNLRCTWCDTPYALELRQGKQKEVNDIVNEINSYNCNHLVITGGEPMLQQEELREVLDQLVDYFVEIETNGSFASEIDEFINQYNCSPKLPSSGNKEYELKLLPNDKTWYKFVIDSDEDFIEARKYINKLNLPKNRIQLMPQGSTRKIVNKNSDWLIEKCRQEGYAFCPRLHIMLWNGKRGR